MRIVLISLFTLIVSAVFAQQVPDEIFAVVDEMPRFPGCEDLELDTKEKKNCADKLMLEFIYSNVLYPEDARQNDIQGTVVIKFVVEKDGSISQTKILKDIGGGCGEEALRVVNTMNEFEQNWIPGKMKGETVRVYFNLPVKFKLKEAPKYYMDGRDSIYIVYDTPPEFEGGLESLEQYLIENLKIPQTGEDSCMTGVIECSTMIRANGEVLVLETKDYNGLGWDFEYEATHTITSSMFKWTPAMYQGRKVSAAYNIRLPFKPKTKTCASEVEKFDQAIELQNEGIDLYNEQKIEEAINKWTSAINLFPQNTELRLLRGQALIELERSPEACADLQLVKARGIPNVYSQILHILCLEKKGETESNN